jgi:phage gp36-like protein
MGYLDAAEINTHLYGGVVNEISRDDITILDKAIAAAIAEALGYLTAYDTTAIFAAVDDARNPILLLYIKDIAVWHYIQLANPAVEMELRLKRYEHATKFLEKVQAGKVNPDLPYPAAPPTPGEATTYIKYGTIDKRTYDF